MAQVSTLQATADAVIASSNKTSNYGGSDSLYMGEFSDGRISKVYTNFDISGIPAYARVASATLSLLQWDSDNDWQVSIVEFAARLARGAWTEGGITWDNAPGIAANSPTALHSVQGQDTWHDWNVTAHMQAVLNGTIPWNGFHLYYTGTSSSTMKYFRSRDYGAAYAPQLSVTWDYPFPKIQVGNAWHQISDAWINVGGVCRRVTEFRINVGGAWRSLG